MAGERREHYNVLRLQVDSADPSLRGKNRSNTSYSVSLPATIANLCALELSGWQIPGDFNPSFWSPNPAAGVAGNDALDWEVTYETGGQVLAVSGSTFFPNRSLSPEQLLDFIDGQMTSDVNQALEPLDFEVKIRAVEDKAGRLVVELSVNEEPPIASLGLRFLLASGPNAHRSAAATLGFRSEADGSADPGLGPPAPQADVDSTFWWTHHAIRAPASMALNRLGSLDVEVRPAGPLEQPLERIYPASFQRRYYDQTNAQGRRGGFFPRGSRVHLKTSDSDRSVRHLEVSLTYAGRDPGDFAAGGVLPDHALQFDAIYLNRTGGPPVPAYLDARVLV